ncbi:ATP-binding protein [Sphingosinicella sp. LY1275]|uniref:ATP-binding protein n=1 Tax=Sphingosinicella sp. LY1275 TaxID=3095379 RepID=UPI002ADECC7A|nr:ATP-binding protein [Sphingosinicella sp. LY1275]MEA1014633.1 ATP-binding protein [Sphingosinicella sp. LY1275]
MGSNRFFRPVAAVVAALAGLVAATSAGAPLVAALIAIVAGAIALAVLAAPGTAEPVSEPVAEGNGDSFLPETDVMVDAVDYPLLVVRERRVILANLAAKDVLGAHIEGVDVRLGIRHPAAAEQLLVEQMDGPSRTELVGLGGEDRRWDMTIAPLPDGSRLVRLVDRSEAHAAEQMRVDFVANASHELRTPLATLIGFAETLHDDDSADPATRKRFLSIMSGEARRMQQLVEDLISLSRIEAERFSVPRDPVPLLPLVEEVRAGCAQLIAEKNSRIEIEGADIAPVVPGDRAQLLQLLRNLVINALKYGRSGEPVTVRFDEAGPDMLQLSVVDRGDGIPAEHLPRLTERFYRVDPGRSRAIGGTGLGLAIVKHIAQRHRGRLEIASVVDQGTAVRVTLPLSSKSHASVTETTSSGPRDEPEAA